MAFFIIGAWRYDLVRRKISGMKHFIGEHEGEVPIVQVSIVLGIAMIAGILNIVF